MNKKDPGRSVSIQVLISVPFTVVTLTVLIILGVLLYGQFVSHYEKQTGEASEQLLGQTVLNLEDYLRNMRRISDAMYYNVIKSTDLASDSVVDQMDLLYEANRDKLVSIACFYSGSGVLTGACPVSALKARADVTEQEWFKEAKAEPENFHFSAPHVQNLFTDSSYRYYWVISLSRSVELTRNGVSNQGILLVDMNYDGIVRLLDKANDDELGGYVYMMDQNGEIIYHPRMNLIRAGAADEDTASVLNAQDASFRSTFEGRKRLVTVRTVAYTGWKLVRVVPMSAFEADMAPTRYLVISLISLTLAAVILINQLLTARITMPLRRLNRSVEQWEAGNRNPDIYIGGSAEVRHLGKTLSTTMGQVGQLMDDIVVEQEEKRKSELDALQSQINPHFLYNTLDSIVWLIAGGRYQDAVFMVKQLASLFRISLSRGKTIIPIREEVQHAMHYVNIQKARYKNDFTVEFRVDEDVMDACTVKLILQPLLENAIYYGMEYMDDEGEIDVEGRRDGDRMILSVTDNGPGMPEEKAARLLTEEDRTPSRGSGVGLINVHHRIRLRFGEQYGLKVESRPDEGFRVEIALPFIPATEENLKALEEGKMPRGGDAPREGGETPREDGEAPREGGNAPRGAEETTGGTGR